MRSTYTLGPLEKDIMQHLWEGNSKTVRQVHTFLEVKRDIAYTTVMTIMTRLTDKGFLLRKKIGKTYFYSPKKNEKQVIKKVVQNIFDSMVNQFGQEAIIAFADELEKVSAKKKRRLVLNLKKHHEVRK